VLYSIWCLSKSYAHTNNCKKKLVEKRERKKRKTEKKSPTAQTGANVSARGFNAGLLVRSQFATGQLDQGFPRSQSKC
jgi:hypothetical protein